MTSKSDRTAVPAKASEPVAYTVEGPGEDVINSSTSTFECHKQGFQQGADGTIVLKLAVPVEQLPMWLMSAPPKTRLLIAAVQLTDDEDLVEQVTGSERQRMVAMAGMLCKEAKFQHFMLRHYDADGLISGACDDPTIPMEEAVRETLCRFLGVHSRKELARNTAAAEKMRRLVREYRNQMSSSK